MEFKHKSVLLDETVGGLNIKPDGIYVDGTLGGAAFSYQKSGEWNEQDQQDQEWDASENICDHIQDLI